MTVLERSVLVWCVSSAVTASWLAGPSPVGSGSRAALRRLPTAMKPSSSGVAIVVGSGLTKPAEGLSGLK